jgi:hypothetical protein
MDWCVKPYGEANHHPRVKVNGDDTQNILRIKATEGESISLDAGASSDPDGDDLTFKWWVYPEPSGLEIDAFPTILTDQTIEFNPGDYPGGDTIHLVVEVRDNGQPSLTSYRRVIIFRSS